MGRGSIGIAGAALALALVAAACGGRSALSDLYAADGAGGAGGAASAGASGTTTYAASSGTGAGGMTEPCDGLAMTGEPISVASSGSQSEPALSVASDGDVVLVHMQNKPPLLGFGRFDGWAAGWPKDLEQHAIPYFVFVDGFIAGPGPKGPSLIVNQGTGEVSIFLAEDFIGGVVNGFVIESGAWRELFLTHFDDSPFDDRRLVALRNELDASRIVLLELGLSSPWKKNTASGCAEKPFESSVPVLAAASPVPGGQLVAVSSGAPFGECDSAPTFGPPTRLQVGHFKLGISGALGAEIELPEPVAHLALAPRAVTAEGPGGAWLVYQSDGSTSLTPPPVMAARLDALGALVGEPFAVTPDGATQGPIAAAALGERLVVVWYDAIDPGPPSLVAQLVEPDGSLGPSAWLTSEPWIDPSRLALLGSPDGKQFVVAWTSSSSGPEERRVRIARFGCAAAP